MPTTEAPSREGFGSALARRFVHAIDGVVRLLVGDDVFISYSRRDGGAYALELANRLTEAGLSPRLDQWGSRPSVETLPPDLRRALRRSSMLVLLVTPESLASEYVSMELEAFLRTGRPLIPIFLLGSDDPALATSGWLGRVEGLASEWEHPERLNAADPGPRVITRIVEAKGFKSRRDRLRRALWLYAAGFAALLLATLFVFRSLTQTRRELSVAGKKLAVQTEAIEQRDGRIAEQEASLGSLEDQIGLAETQIEEARVEIEKAEEERRKIEFQAERQRHRLRILDYLEGSRREADVYPLVALAMALEGLDLARDAPELEERLLSEVKTRLRDGRVARIGILVSDVEMLPGGNLVVTEPSSGLVPPDRLEPSAREPCSGLRVVRRRSDHAELATVDCTAQIAGGPGGWFTVWEPGRPRELRDRLGQIVDEALPPGEAEIVGSADGRWLALDFGDRAELRSALDGRRAEALGPARRIAFHPSGPHFAVTRADGSAELWATGAGGGTRALVRGLAEIHFTPRADWYVRTTAGGSAVSWFDDERTLELPGLVEGVAVGQDVATVAYREGGAEFRRPDTMEAIRDRTPWASWQRAAGGYYFFSEPRPTPEGYVLSPPDTMEIRSSSNPDVSCWVEIDIPKQLFRRVPKSCENCRDYDVWFAFPSPDGEYLVFQRREQELQTLHVPSCRRQELLDRPLSPAESYEFVGSDYVILRLDNRPAVVLRPWGEHVGLAALAGVEPFSPGGDYYVAQAMRRELEGVLEVREVAVWLRTARGQYLRKLFPDPFIPALQLQGYAFDEAHERFYRWTGDWDAELFDLEMLRWAPDSGALHRDTLISQGCAALDRRDNLAVAAEYWAYSGRGERRDVKRPAICGPRTPQPGEAASSG